MIVKTQAICIKNTRYGESSVIAKMFTREFGMCSYIIQGLTRRTSGIRPSHISPGNIVEMVVYQKPGANIQRVKELRLTTPLIRIQSEMPRNAILQFILELTARTTEDHIRDELVYEHLSQTILNLETNESSVGSMPLLFLCTYLKFTGWYPNLDQWEDGYVFDLPGGRFGNPLQIPHLQVLDPEISSSLYTLLKGVTDRIPDAVQAPALRRSLFNSLILYYEIHVLKGKKMRSPEILATLFS